MNNILFVTNIQLKVILILTIQTMTVT